jgi:serine/threonine protein kinase/WD40 repeat protein
MADNKDELFGREIRDFVLGELIGEGGFGKAYRGEQPTLGREVVVKVLHHRLRVRDILLQRFLREAQLASRLDHPYAAHVYGFGGEEDGLVWIAMEFVHGITLKQWLIEHGPMPLAQLVPFFEHVTEVVQNAHDHGIVHRDLKPSNVMVIERAGRLFPKLLDFGVAKLLDGEKLPESTPDTIRRLRALVVEKVPDEVLAQFRQGGASTVTGDSPALNATRLTPDSATIGTPGYMAPEQWSREFPVGPASDLYALAVVAYEALTGRRPFEETSMSRGHELQGKELHGKPPSRGQVPPLGGAFPPALDPMFQRALAERPGDRFGTALELAGALRAAADLGASRADLPRIDAGVRDAWVAGAPEPLAELVAVLDSARNAHQARIATQDLSRALLRYLLAVALATHAERHGHDDPALLKLVRALDSRELITSERVQLLRLLVRPLTRQRDAHPIPALVDLVTPGSGTPDGLEDGLDDGLAPILALHGALDHAGTEDVVRSRLSVLIPELTKLLRRTAFVLEYQLVVPRDRAAERWTGRRRQPRASASVSVGELIDRRPMLLDRNGQVCVDLWPLVQAVPPTEGAEPELFVFDGYGRHGALLIAAPAGLERQDAVAQDWVATHVIAAIETMLRMRDQIRVAARQWQARDRPNSLLWRGEVLADLERWTRHAAGMAALGEPEASFVAASRRAGRRARWIRRLLVAAAVATVLGVVEYRSAMKQRMAAQLATQAEVGEGRQALLHDDFAEARLHLAQAHQRGDHSPAVTFMLARALQPRLAELARLSSSSGRMWSVMFSPDGLQIVTTDDVCAQVWDARTSRLLFTLPHGDTVYHAVYSADGARLETASGDGVIRIWDAANGALVRELKHDGKKVRYWMVAASPDGKVIAAIDTEGEVARVWDADTGVPLAELRNVAAEAPSLAFSSDGRWLATSGGDDVRVFDARTWAHTLTIAGPHIRRMVFDPTGPRLATVSAEGDAAIWTIPGGERVRHLREVGDPVDRVAFSPDGELVVTGSRDGTEQIWDARSGALRSQVHYLKNKIMAVEFDQSSKLVLAAGADGAVVVVDAALGMLVTVLEGPSASVLVAHFDPTSRRVVGASSDGTARVWDATSPYLRWSTPPISSDCGLGTSLEPDRRFVAIGCRGHATRVWDTARDQLLAQLPIVTQVEGDFTSAFPTVSAAGDRAAIARGPHVEVYELPGGRLLRTIDHLAAVNAVAFASTGHDVVSGDVDGVLQVTRDGQPPIALPVLPGGIDVAAICRHATAHLRPGPQHSARTARCADSCWVAAAVDRWPSLDHDPDLPRQGRPPYAVGSRALWSHRTAGRPRRAGVLGALCRRGHPDRGW